MMRAITTVAAVTTLSLVLFSEAANALNRVIRDCSDPFGNDSCLSGSFVSFYNYNFGRREGDPPRGPNPMPAPFFGSTDVDDAYDMVPFIAAYWMETFGRDGANNLGGTGDGINKPFDETQVFVHTDGNSNIAPTCAPNGGGASANEFGIQFCTGQATNPDLIGHEYAHLVALYRSVNPLTGTPSPLIYEDEPGALNESFADLMGEAFERYRTGSNDWLVKPSPPLNLLRSLSNPPSLSNNVAGTPNPDRFHDPNCYCGEADHGGVHTNSTIPSKAAYLFVEGGSFNGWSLTGVSFTAMEQVWYRALNEYYSNTETFNQAYLHLRQAARDLYGANSLELSQLTMALRAVELDQPGFCSGLPLRRWGDFDQNDLYTLSDSDALVAAINTSSTDLAFDINGDDLVTAADYLTWRGLAAYFTLGPGLSYLAGDADLDGDVDGRDFLLWQRQFGTQVVPYSGADANGDGWIDDNDLVDWRQNYGLSSTITATVSVPEPATLAMLLPLLLLCWRRSKKDIQ